MVEEVNDYKCATCLIELEKYLIMRKYSLARHLAEYGDNYRRCEKSRDLYGQYDEIEKIIKEIEKYGPEQLISLVAHGDIDYAVCDESIARAVADSLSQIDISTAISFTQFYSWAVSKQSPV